MTMACKLQNVPELQGPGTRGQRGVLGSRTKRRLPVAVTVTT